MNEEKILDISWATIWRISLAFIVFYILYLIKDILIWFIFALIISLLFNPAIDFLQKKKIPRAVGVIFMYTVVFGIIGFAVSLIIPIFVKEIQQFLQVFPQYFEKIAPPLKSLGWQSFDNIESFIEAFGNNLEKVATNIFNTIFAIFGGILSTIFVITLAMFLSWEEKLIERTISLLSPKKYEAYVLDLWTRCQKTVSWWFVTRIIGCLFVGVFSYFTFLLFNIKYSFALALLSCVLNFIPIVGPIATGILIFLMISLDSVSRAVFALIAFTLIQQVEGNVLTPILTKKFIGLPPVLVLISLTVGVEIGGLLGAILAIPLAGILFVFFKEFLQKKKEEETTIL